MIDTVYVGDDFHSLLVDMLAQTRAPFITIQHKTTPSALSAPYVMTAGGIVFGLPAIVDFLLNRITEPPLLHADIKRRCLQTTVFWALATREFEKIRDASGAQQTAWASELTDQLRSGRFYTGDEFTLCDVALASLLVFIEQGGTKLSTTHIAYVDRCLEYIEQVTERNSENSTHDD